MLTTDYSKQQPQGWVALFLKAHPLATKTLVAHGIHNDISYRNAEHRLDTITRQRLGIFRAYSLLGTAHTDLCKLARCAPPWLAERKLASLNISARARSVFENNNLYTVADLGGWSSQRLLAEPQFGFKSFCNVLRALKATLNKGLVSESEQLLNGDKEPRIAPTKSSRLLRAEQLQRVRQYARNCIDPCALARAARPWLAEKDIEELDIRFRVYSCLRRNNIRTVADLAARTYADMLALRRLSVKSLHSITRALSTLLNDDFALQTANSGDNKKSKQGSAPCLIDEIKLSLALVNHRQRHSIQEYLGFGWKPQTIHEMALSYGKTQNQMTYYNHAAIRRWLYHSGWHSTLIAKILALLKSRTQPLSLSEITAIDPWFRDITKHQAFFRKLIRTTTRGSIYLLEIDGQLYFSTIVQETWNKHLRDARALLRSAANKRWRDSEARLLVYELLPDTAKTLRLLLWEQAARCCYFAKDIDGTRTLLSYEGKIEHFVKVMLSESNSPLHYRGIAQRINDQRKRKVCPETVRLTVAKNAWVFDVGVYGLAKHIPFSDGQMSYFCTLAEDIMRRKAPAKQWHATELLAQMMQQSAAACRGLDEYLLAIALSHTQRLRTLGRMVWVLNHFSKDEQRLPIQQAVVDILRSAGQPLTIDEIRKRLMKRRGVGKRLCINSTAPLVRIARGVWGINDRDVPLTRAEQGQLIEQLVDELKQRQTPIHRKELPSILALQKCSAHTFVSIAGHDKRLRTTHSEYICLAEWPIGRRKKPALDDTAGEKKAPTRQHRSD